MGPNRLSAPSLDPVTLQHQRERPMFTRLMFYGMYLLQSYLQEIRLRNMSWEAYQKGEDLTARDLQDAAEMEATVRIAQRP